MQFEQDSLIDKEMILQEIFMVPSQKCLENRFSNIEEAPPAPCNGKCHSGACVGFM